jgi:hypothetical protein
MSTIKNSLINCFSIAKNMDLYIYVVVSVNGKEEIIINKPYNVADKLDYYKKAYNDNLELISNPKIKIIDFGCRKKDILIKELSILL